MFSVVESFVELGKRLQCFGNDEYTLSVIAEACKRNEWFSQSDICRAIDAIRCQFLDSDKLTAWLSRYDTSHIEPKRVAIIMAGNIPLVGFFDLMCVLLSGHTALVKPSSKDRVLTDYIISELKAISPTLPIYSYDETSVCDMVIATGGDSAATYFRTRFADIPSLVRGSRHSLAVLGGNESEEEMLALSRDIFTYSGLGCRNVSLVMLPRGCELNLQLSDAVNEMYRGCYLSSRAIMEMTAKLYKDLGCVLAIEQCAFSDNISCVNYFYYDTLEQVEEWISANDDSIQCIVSRTLEHPRRVDFGMAQYPALDDYADGVDVMEFLISN